MSSQTINALITLREQILNGELAPGERLLELALVERLGVSRTPIRSALTRLAEEGLLEEISGGGYAVREFTVRDIEDAIEARGSLEGMAARLAAERGVSPLALRKIKESLEQFDRLLEKTDLESEDIERYFDLNELFHNQLIMLTESFVIEHALRRINALPFASANAFVMAQSELGNAWKVFFVAQEQHRGIVEAIENREGTRAESLTREHARLSLSTLKTALKTQAALEQVPGLKLVYTPN
ncbi:MAG: GntR family transcriptional regulator [Anaerolineaceae bacterium]|nr:GntR family transcriptional regulator [Anaerolineaceae bacterium]